MDGLSERIERIESAIEAHDVDSLIQTAHALHGAAGLYGYERLAKLALDRGRASTRWRDSRRSGSPGKGTSRSLQRDPTGVPGSLIVVQVT